MTLYKSHDVRAPPLYQIRAHFGLEPFNSDYFPRQSEENRPVCVGLSIYNHSPLLNAQTYHTLLLFPLQTSSTSKYTNTLEKNSSQNGSSHSSFGRR
jgi:hypothetical protein